VRRLRGMDGWQQHHAVPWQSEQLWPYHSLMSLDAWILHSGHAKSLHLGACTYPEESSMDTSGARLHDEHVHAPKCKLTLQLQAMQAVIDDDSLHLVACVSEVVIQQ